MPEEIRENIPFKPYVSKDKKYVICLDTLGQDRKLSDDQMRFALNACQKYKEIWESFEKEKIQQDVVLRVGANESDKAWLEEHKDAQAEEEAKIIEERLVEIEDFADDDHKKLFSTHFALEHQAKFLQENEDMKKRFEDLKQVKVIKFGKIFQALFYFLGYDWDKVVEAGTQSFHWKTAKQLIDDDFFKKLQEYKIMGPKEGEYKKY